MFGCLSVNVEESTPTYGKNRLRHYCFVPPYSLPSTSGQDNFRAQHRLLIPAYDTMADPLSVTASIVGLVGFGTTLLVKVDQLIGDFSSADEDISSLTLELKGLCRVLDRLEGFSRDPGLEAILPRQLVEDLIPILESCTQVFKRLEAIVNRLRRASGSSWARMKWMLKDKDIAKIRNGLAEHKLTLNMALTVASCLTTHRLEVSTNRIQQCSEEILQKIDRLLEQDAEEFADVSDSSAASSVIMRRFLDGVTSYAESVLTSSPATPRVSTSEVPTEGCILPNIERLQEVSVPDPFGKAEKGRDLETDMTFPTSQASIGIARITAAEITDDTIQEPWLKPPMSTNMLQNISIFRDPEGPYNVPESSIQSPHQHCQYWNTPPELDIENSTLSPTDLLPSYPLTPTLSHSATMHDLEGVLLLAYESGLFDAGRNAERTGLSEDTIDSTESAPINFLPTADGATIAAKNRSRANTRRLSAPQFPAAASYLAQSTDPLPKTLFSFDLVPLSPEMVEGIQRQSLSVGLPQPSEESKPGGLQDFSRHTHSATVIGHRRTKSAGEKMFHKLRSIFGSSSSETGKRPSISGFGRATTLPAEDRKRHSVADVGNDRTLDFADHKQRPTSLPSDRATGKQTRGFKL